MKRLGVLLALVVALFPPPAHAEDVARIEVAFEVENVNRSALPCSVNNLRYRVRGEIVGPASRLRGGSVSTATLYLHEFSFGRFFWRFDDVPGYDHATELAEAGHVSVVVDRIGYDSSDHPPGTAVCLGSQADIAAQLVRHLRQGTYTALGGGQPVAIGRVVLAGHSVGAAVAELAAHSFPDLDLAGLAVFGWADQGYSARALEQAVRQGADCLAGGEPAHPGGPPGYAYYGRTEGEFRANVFADTDPVVADRATARRNRDPCGDNATLARVAVVNQLGLKNVTVPVLLVFGEEDAVFQDGAMADQAALFERSPSVTTKSIPKAGHALTLERSAGLVRTTTASWLATVTGSPAPAAGTTTSTTTTTSAPAESALSATEAPPPVAPSNEVGTLPETGGAPATTAPVLGAAAAACAYVLSRARRSTSSTIGTISGGGLLPRNARNSGTAAAGSLLSSKRIMPLKKRASG